MLNAGLAVVLAVVVGAGLLIASGRTASGTETSTLRTVAVRTGDVTSSVTADGSVEAVNEVAANFETSGTIARLLVKVGDTVTKGEVIATLERADARRDLKVARLQLSAAQEQLDSAEEGTTSTDPQTGKTTTTVSSSQVASAEAQVVQAQATYDDAEAALEATTLRAPISGTVLQVNGKVGSSSGASTSQTAAAGATTSTTTDLVLVANLKALQVSVSVPESDIGSLKVDQKATVTFPAVDGAEATGTITTIDPVATTSNSVVTYGVVVRLSGVPSTVRLGQSASVTVTTDTATDVLVVPSTAVTTTGDRSTVTVLANGVQTPTVVTLGVVGDTWTEVESGVSSGDQVVLATSTSSSSIGSGFPGGFGGLTGGPPAGVPAGGIPGGGP
jgi:macrolide-specific efflux system membrane fusion protein